jgi:MFS family permease
MNNKDAYAALKIKDYRRFITAKFLLTIGIQMQSVIVGWQIYELTHDALSLGLIGISEALPFLAITLFAGHIADIVSRKKIMIVSNAVYFVCATALLLIATQFHPALSRYGALPIYIIIFFTGLARGFMSPAQNAFALNWYAGIIRQRFNMEQHVVAGRRNYRARNRRIGLRIFWSGLCLYDSSSFKHNRINFIFIYREASSARKNKGRKYLAEFINGIEIRL